MNELGAPLAIKEIVLASLPVLLVEHELADQVLVVLELGVHDLDIHRELLHQLAFRGGFNVYTIRRLVNDVLMFSASFLTLLDWDGLILLSIPSAAISTSMPKSSLPFPSSLATELIWAI